MKTHIQNIRESLELNQSKFAKVLGMSAGLISNYELKRRIPKPLFAKKIVEFAKANGIKKASLDLIYSDYLHKNKFKKLVKIRIKVLQ